MLAERSLFFYLLFVVMSLGAVQSLIIGGLFFLKKSGERRANRCYAFLLITLGLTLIHNIFILIDLFDTRPYLKGLPLYYTLSFPALLFFYVKLDLFPAYRIKWSDSKHFVMPLSQFIFFILMGLNTIFMGIPLDRYFFNPFYGALEQLLYLTFFFSYIYFAYRYVKQKQKRVRNRHEAKKINYHRVLLKTLFMLFSIHTFFVLSDYIFYNYFLINLQTSKPYAAMGMLSFAAIVYWMGTYGFQVLVWGRKLFYRR